MVNFYLVVAFKDSNLSIGCTEGTMEVKYSFVRYDCSSYLMEDNVDAIYVFLTPEQLQKKIDDLTNSEYQMYVKYILTRLSMEWEKLNNES